MSQLATISVPDASVSHECSAPMLNTATSFLLLLVLLVIAACDRPKNACPIDGQPPEAITQRNGESCEYFHYSVIEKKNHSWWAKCTPGATQ